METSEDTQERIGRDVALFLAGACLFRILFWAAMGRVLDAADAIHYIASARTFAAGDFFGVDPKIPILYPLFGGLASLIVRDPEFACRLASLIASSLLVVPVYGLARDLHGRAAARMAALIVAIWPWLADYGSQVSTEALACTLWFLAVWSFARGLRRGGLWPILAALAFFGLHLTRPEGIVVLLAALPMAALLCVRATDVRLARLIPFVLVAGVLLAGHALYMDRLVGRPTLIYRAAYLVEELHISNDQRTAAGTALLFAKTTADTLFQVLPIMLGPVLLIFLGVGLFQPSERQRDVRLELALLGFAAVQWAASLTVLSPAPRYLMTVLIALTLWSARGIVLVGRSAAALPYGRMLRVLPAAALVCTMALGTTVTLAAEHLGQRPRQPREYKEAGRWMKANLEPGLIFTRKPQVGYYADMPTTGPALEDSIASALERALQAGARYLVVDERYTAQMVPALKPLLDPAQAPPGLRLLHNLVPDYPEARVVVYEILDGAANAP